MKRVYPDNEGRPRLANPVWFRLTIFCVLVGVVVVLAAVFPAALRFVEMAAREVRYLWWLILLVLLGCWLIWGYGKSSK